MGKTILSDEEMDRLPLGMTGFWAMRNDGILYVDKTKMIRKIARIKGTPVFLSRPRRFGKSLLVSTFETLFSRGLQDFKGLDIDTGEKKWTDKKYKVLRIDFSMGALLNADVFTRKLTAELYFSIYGKKEEMLTENQKSQYPDTVLFEYASLAAAKSIVLLIDEYDSPVSHHIGNKAELDKIMAVIWNFFATVKRFEEKFRFVFITGITRVAHISLFSVFNNLNDISCDDEYATLLGITDEELKRYFDPYVRNAASVLDMSVSDVYDRMKTLYDGFQFSIGTNMTVYNPWSVLSFLSNPERGFKNYWYNSNSGTPTILVKYLENADYLDLFNKISYRVKEGSLAEYLADEDMLLSKSEPDQIPIEMLLYQTGYFTLRTDSPEMAKLAIPNDEVSESMIKLSLDVNHMTPSLSTKSKLNKIGSLVDSGDIAGMFDLFNAALCEGVSSNAKVFDDENTVRDFIYVQLPRKGILKSREKCNVHGYSDMEIQTRTTKLVIEFKRIRKGVSQKAAMKEALDQIRTHDYGVTPEDIKLIQVGMVISPEQKKLAEYQILDDKS